ncbi:MAG: cytochrome P450, partial [Bacteroidota bacterium]
FNITTDVFRITSDVVMQTLLGVGDMQSNKEIQEIIAETQDYIIDRIRMPFLAFWAKLSGRHRRVMKRMHEFDQRIFEIIESRADQTEPSNDLLAMLMDARDENGEPMSRQQLRDEVITIYVAGHETSANALSWTIMQLCQNPAVKAHMIQEIRQQLQGRKPNLSDIKSMPYLMQVIQESMRLYPPAWSVSRECTVKSEIAGHPVDAGQVIFLSIHALHRHPDQWEDPEAFRPERFEPEKVKARPNHHYIPFGAGPRMCIGNHFAMMEIAIILAAIFDRYDFELDPTHQVEMVPLVTLQAKPGIRVKVL